MKSQVFKIAHRIKDKFTTWSDALKYAWNIVKLRYCMFKGIVEFRYYKVDGSIRKATGTLKHSLVSYIPKTGKTNENVFTYFDLEKESFRCFRIENLCLSA